jgi:F-type H+-transporting ATPase subunit b
MEALIGTFHIDWKLMVAQIVNFGIVFAVLFWFVIRPLSKTLKDRKIIIEQGLSDAEKNAVLLKEAETAHDEEVSKGRAEAHELILEMKKTAEEKRIELVNQAEKEVNKMIEDGRRSIKQEKDQMMEHLEKDIATLVISATEKIIGEHTIKQDVIQKTIDNLKGK